MNHVSTTLLTKDFIISIIRLSVCFGHDSLIHCDLCHMQYQIPYDRMCNVNYLGESQLHAEDEFLFIFETKNEYTSYYNYYTKTIALSYMCPHAAKTAGI